MRHETIGDSDQAVVPRLPSARRGPAALQRARRPPAFTILELILSLGIVLILIGLTWPSLADARDRARTAASIGNLRQHALVMNLYCSDYEDWFPNFVPPDPNSKSHFEIQGRIVEVKYLHQTIYWHLFLVDYYGGEFAHPSFFSPGSAERDHLGYCAERGCLASYWYSTTCLTDPAYWDPETHLGPRQWRGVLRSEVASPSQKGLLIQMTPSQDRGRRSWINASFMDGHADRRAESEYAMPLMGDWMQWTRTGPTPVLHTVGGVRGQDVP